MDDSATGRCESHDGLRVWITLHADMRFPSRRVDNMKSPDNPIPLTLPHEWAHRRFERRSLVSATFGLLCLLQSRLEFGMKGLRREQRKREWVSDARWEC